MRKLIGQSSPNDSNKSFNAWDIYFSSQTNLPIEELNVNLGKLIAASNSRGPLFQSLERGENFLTELEKNVTKLQEFINEKKESKKFKKLEEIPSIDEYVKQIH
jgi:hypothetical protein